MIILVQNNISYEPDLKAILQAFFPAEKIKTMSPEEVAQVPKDLQIESALIMTALYDDRASRIRIEEKGHVLFSAYCYGDYNNRKKFRNRLKLMAYRLLSEYTGRELPWGSLTGMRPTKIATKALNDGLNKSEVIEYYQKTYDTSAEKAALSTTVAINEKKILENVNPITDYCLYIGIPFCPTRCLYCSFAAVPIMEYEGLVDRYLDALEKQLQYIAFLNRDRHLISIYIGGGTPTALNAKQLERLMEMVDMSFTREYLKEYTVEAGRPDSVNREKLKVLKKAGVTRISINPQTMNDRTLKIIGRAHTPADIKRAFSEARKEGFDNINMDIIAGLPGEELDDMRHTLHEIWEMNPECLTVHSLAIKRSANLNMRLDEYRSEINHDTAEEITLATEQAEHRGLEPYYLYRQRNIAGNLENTGFAKPGLECWYNVLIMEEKIDTFAAGAGAISRLVSVDPDTGEHVRTDRVENVKNVRDFIDRIDEMQDRIREAMENKGI